MNLKKGIKTLSLVWIALLGFFLLCPTIKTSAQGYIGLHVKGDTIAIDTAVVLDVKTYRSIRNYNITSNDLVASKIGLIKTLEKQVAFGDSIILSQNLKLELLFGSLQRKDTVIADLSTSFNQLDSANTATVDMLQKALNKKNPLITDERLWIGVGIGVIGGLLLSK